MHTFQTTPKGGTVLIRPAKGEMFPCVVLVSDQYEDEGEGAHILHKGRGQDLHINWDEEDGMDVGPAALVNDF